MLLKKLEAICDEIFDRWDSDQRSGKLLSALAGRVSRYRPDVTEIREALAGPQPMATARRDGSPILAFLYRGPDDCGYPGFGEWREIWWKPYTSLGMFMPWHAGDPADSHTRGEAPEHFGEGVPVAWLPKPTTPPLPLIADNTDAVGDQSCTPTSTTGA